MNRRDSWAAAQAAFKPPFEFVKGPEVGSEGYVIQLKTFSKEQPDKPIWLKLDVRVLPIEKAKLNPAG
jgi:hypothetical protein